jgi:hypothetical protein
MLTHREGLVLVAGEARSDLPVLDLAREGHLVKWVGLKGFLVGTLLVNDTLLDCN